MAFRALAASALVFLSGAPASEAVALKSIAISQDHPVVSIIELLKNLEEKVDQEAKDEELLYVKFSHWCQNSEKTLNKAITEEKATMEKLESELDSLKKNIEVLGKEIGALDDELLELSGAGGAAHNDRTAGSNLYTAQESSLTDTISAIEQAIEALSSAKTSTDSGFLLAQQRVSAALALASYKASDEELRALQDFASANTTENATERPDLKAEGDNEAHVKKYGFKSNSVIELLKDLKLKFEDELTAATSAETFAVNAYELAKQAREEVVAAKGAAKSAKLGEKGQAEGELSASGLNYNGTKDDLQADSDSLKSTHKACNQKQSEWEERSAMRAREQDAIRTAISILAKVTGVRTEAPSNPILPTSPVSFLQVANRPATEKAIRLLRSEAKSEHSKVLEQLAATVEKHGDGPFDQVVNVIQKMVFRLMHEQTEEDDHKHWCDQEINKTDASIADKQDKVTELGLKIADAVAQAVALATDIQNADNMVGTITQHIQEATEIREIGHEENNLAIKDAKAAQVSLANAVAVLKQHYKESGAMVKESWEFVQASRAPVDLSENPSTWDSAYTAVADPAQQPDGIVSVLEQVSADFARMESDTYAGEASDKQAYDEDMKNCEIEKARRAKEAEVKGQERKRQLDKQTTLEGSKKAVAKEMEATEQYLHDLQPACVQGDSTYEDRKAARAQEIDALHEAQGLLTDAFKGNSTAEAGNSTADANATAGTFLARHR